MSTSKALSFHIQSECSTTRARVGLMKLPHYTVNTPVFMPVGTQVRKNKTLKIKSYKMKINKFFFFREP